MAEWIWEALTTCKCCLKLFGARLPCVGAHLLYTWLRLSYEGMANTLSPQGKSGDGRNSLHLCKIPRGVFSWCGYDLMIFFQNILFCTNLLKQLYIHFWRTILKKNLEKEGTMDLAEFHFSVHKILFRISNVASRRLSNKLCKNLYSCEPFHFIPICLILE